MLSDAGRPATALSCVELPDPQLNAHESLQRRRSRVRTRLPGRWTSPTHDERLIFAPIVAKRSKFSPASRLMELLELDATPFSTHNDSPAPTQFRDLQRLAWKKAAWKPTLHHVVRDFRRRHGQFFHEAGRHERNRQRPDGLQPDDIPEQVARRTFEDRLGTLAHADLVGPPVRFRPVRGAGERPVSAPVRHSLPRGPVPMRARSGRCHVQRSGLGRRRGCRTSSRIRIA